MAELPSGTDTCMSADIEGSTRRFPGLAITLTALGLNDLADALQDAIEPRRARAATEPG